MKKQKQNTPKTMLTCAVLFAATGLLNGYVAIRDGSGLNMAAAVIWLAGAAIWFSRWRGAKREECAPAEPFDPENEPPEEPARFWPWGGLWGR